MRRCFICLSCILLMVGCSEKLDSLSFAQGKIDTPQPGQVLVLNYWAKWCKPCRQEIPELNHLGTQADDVLVLGVDFDNHQGAELLDLIEMMGIKFAVLSNVTQAGLLHPRLQQPPSVLPTTQLLYYSAETKLPAVLTLVGPQTAAGLAEQISRLRGGKQSLDDRL